MTGSFKWDMKESVLLCQLKLSGKHCNVFISQLLHRVMLAQWVILDVHLSMSKAGLHGSNLQSASV